MRKSLLAVIAIVLFTLFLSASGGTATASREGETAPNFRVANSDTVFELQHHRGSYVVVTLWSSADAQSRVANCEQARLAADCEGLEHVSLNFDRSERVFDEICRLDGVDTASQFHLSPQSDIAREWHLDEGYASYLINPEGVIIAKNPTKEEIKNLL